MHEGSYGRSTVKSLKSSDIKKLLQDYPDSYKDSLTLSSSLLKSWLFALNFKCLPIPFVLFIL